MTDDNASTPLPDDADPIAATDDGEAPPPAGEDYVPPLDSDELAILEGERAAIEHGDGDELATYRRNVRRYVALFLITVATSIAAGHTLRQPTFMTANDISRWCTVWSLLERGTYAIDDCPWQTETQDKVQRPPYVGHFYSSKPALISTLIAGMLYPARRLTGVPLERVVEVERTQRWVQKPDPSHPGKFIGVMERPREPVKWPTYIFYFKPVLLAINVIPYALFLAFFARLLDRYAINDWAWFFALFAAAFGTYLLPYTQTLNNHTLGAFAAFFALYHFLRIWDDRRAAFWRFATAGFFAGCTAATELPALAFPTLMAGMLVIRYPSRTLLAFVPATLIPLAALAGAQYAEFGDWKYIPYESFGSEEYLWAGSFWQSPLELDAFNEHPETYRTYLLHLTFGHHGIFSLTPIFLFSAWGAIRLLGGRRLLTLCIVLTLVTIVGLGWYYLRDPEAWDPGGPMFEYAWLLLSIPLLFGLLALLSAIPWLRGIDRPMEALAWMTTILTIVIVAFYTWTPKARNYGGSAQGLRWVMWLIPFWLILLPKGIEEGQARARVRSLAMAALVISAISVGYAMRNPWSHPWILDAMEHLGVYPLTR